MQEVHRARAIVLDVDGYERSIVLLDLVNSLVELLGRFPWRSFTVPTSQCLDLRCYPHIKPLVDFRSRRLSFDIVVISEFKRIRNRVGYRRGPIHSLY